MSSNQLKFPSISTTCTTCTALLVQPDEPLSEIHAISYSGVDIFDSAASECSICSMVAAWLPSLALPKATLENSTITAYLQAGDSRDHEELASCGTAKTDFFCLDFCVDPDLVDPPASQFQIRLRADMSDSQQSRMQLRARDDFYGRSSISVSNEFADSTQHVSCFQQIERWLEICVRDHPSCRTTLDPDTHDKLPTRLIDTYGSQPRLILSSELEKLPIQYITLSHRWHNITMPSLLTTNLEELKKRLDVASFPPTFRDVIEATIRMGFRYIWIDALCIIQDDVQDWKQEAASMALVYHNAVCNLGAHAAAADPENVGLFVRRDPEQMQIPFLKIQRLDWEGNYWADPVVEPKGLSSSPLMQRGWVQQERLLSPRSVYFGSMLRWECSELQATERCPGGLAAPIHFTPWCLDGYPFRIINLLQDHLRKDFRYVIPINCHNDHVKEVYRKWLFVAEWYSNCQLMFEEDYFPALLELVSCFQRSLNDRFFAGVWVNDIMNGLLWLHVPGKTPRYLQRERAPTWSCASIAGEIAYLDVDDAFGYGYKKVWTASVLGIHDHYHDSSSEKHIWQASIQISGIIRHRTSWAHPGTFQNHLSQRNWFDVRQKDGAHQTVRTFTYLLLCYRTRTLKNYAAELIDLKGLLIEQVIGLASTYHRIGMFHHNWEHARDETGNFPPFADFDPKKFSVESLTLI